MESPSLIDVLAAGGTASPLPAGLQTFAVSQRRRTAHPAAAATSVWHELHVELRRQAGNERLPLGLRGTLRQLAQRAAARDARQANAALGRFPRRQLRDAVPLRLPEAQHARVREQLSRAGVDADGPLAVVEARNRPDVLVAAYDVLLSRGLTVATVGHTLPASLCRPGIVELGLDVEPAVMLGLVDRSRMVICGGWDLQYAAALFGRPSVALNGTEPFRLYPVKAGSVFLLRTAIDLGAGRELSLDERLTESYFRNLRHHAYREHVATDVALAVEEVLDGIDRTTPERAAQAAVRERLTAAGQRLAASTRHVMTWGPDGGFLGDGRLARVQAERL